MRKLVVSSFVGLCIAANAGEVKVAENVRCNEPGSLMLLNPAAGTDMYHTVDPACWLIDYKYMHSQFRDLRDGMHNVGTDEAGFQRGKQYDYMLIPSSLKKDVHMFTAAYGVNDDITLLVKGNYQQNDMKLLQDAGPGHAVVNTPPVRTQGFGDTELRSVFNLSYGLTASVGLSLPTGDIEQDVNLVRWDFRAPYDMQLGSGSYDVKPALTYNWLSADALWNAGLQGMYTWRTGDNDNDYRLGDSVEAGIWLQRAFGPAASWVRMAYTHNEKMHGQDAEIQKLLSHSDPADPAKWAPIPAADPAVYGGDTLDLAVGLSCQMGPVSAGVEGGIPVCQDPNGLQLRSQWFMTAGLQAMF